MKIYLDYIFLINFLFDFILLLGVSIVLKRNVSKLRLFLGSLFGGVSFFIIFFSMSSVMFLIVKMLLGVLMVIICFSYKSFRYTLSNFIYLVILSVILGGGLYLINTEIGYSNVGMIFFANGNSVNLFVLILIGFLIVLFYSRYVKVIKRSVVNKYNVEVFIGNSSYKFDGFMDTGNDLLYFNRPVVILNKDFGYDGDYVYIPFRSVNGNSVMKGFKVSKIFVSGKGFFENVYVAIANDKFQLKDCDMILNVNLWEDD